MNVRSLHGLAFACLLAVPLRAQAPAAEPTAPARGEGRLAVARRAAWRVSSVVEIGSEYDDNVYLLRDGARTSLGSPSGSAVASGRFAQMSSASGMIGTMGLAATLRGPGLAGRRLELRPEATLAADALNSARRVVALGFGAVQSLRHGGSVRLDAQVTPSYFARNYMVDARDLDGDGAIASAERVYAAGTYRDAEVGLAYRRRLDKSTKKGPFGAALQVGGGYYARTYDDPFAGRDMRGPTADARLLLDVSRRLDMGVSYGFASLAADPTAQVLVVDEGDVGRDLDGNGATGDPDVRVAAVTDRSRVAHSVGLRATYAVSKRTDLRLDLERRMRSFSSSQPLDFANNGRRDTRDRIAAQLARKLRGSAALTVRGEHSVQRLERERAASIGEIDDYSRNRLAIGLRFGR